MLAIAWPLLLLSALPPHSTAQPYEPATVELDRQVEVVPRPAIGALEEQLTGEVAQHYAAAITAIAASQHRRALSEAKQARALAYQALRRGPTPPRLARRHFTRTVYLEEQLSELTLIEEQLDHPPDRELKRSFLVQIRALLLHNLYLAVRGFRGSASDPSRGGMGLESPLQNRALGAYKLAIDDADLLKHSLLVGYAALLAESGRRSDARRIFFTKLSDSEREQESLDVAVAYFYLALGDRGRAISRLVEASRRDSWLHGSAGRDSQPVRTQVYRMSDFDRLRDHPRFHELVTLPEEG
jgi:hypothetical protein